MLDGGVILVGEVWRGGMEVGGNALHQPQVEIHPVSE
jgi:hypothetical protein